MGALRGGKHMTGGHVPSDIRLDSRAIIVLTGTAPVHTVDPAYKTVNQPVVLLNDTDYVKYLGEDAEQTGYSLQKSVKEIYATGKKYDVIPLVVVVNVFDPATHVDGSADPDPSTVTDSDIIGTIDGGGNRTGMQALLDAKVKTGFEPKIIATPFFSGSGAVARAQELIQSSLKAVGYIDAPLATTVADAKTDRTTEGEAFFTTDKRTSLGFPYMKSISGEMIPKSVYLAAMRAITDLKFGFWYSISSRSIPVLGAETPVTYDAISETAESYLLNTAGIVTYKAVDSDIKINGNWNASYPTNTAADQFEAVVRINDVIDDAITKYMESKMDLPIFRGVDGSLIDDVVTDINRSLFDKLNGKALVNGRCWFEPSANNETDIMAGKIKWHFDMAENVPFNSWEFYKYKNVGYYAEAAQTASGGE